MELQLALSLSNQTLHKISSLRELDLIGQVNSSLQQHDFDNNSSTLSCQSSCVHDFDYDEEEKSCDNGLYMKNRVFDEVMEFSEFCLPKTLPLLSWDMQPNEDDNQRKRLRKSSSFSINKNEGDEIVGWPPIKTYRKKQNVGQLQQRRHGRSFPVVGSGGCCGGSRSKYVKVQMEGCFITRKINLKLYQFYEPLTSSLLHMFGKGEDSKGDYKLTYQDGEGDWLLAGDVPWRTFIQSVQRLKMVRRDC
ncbi:hypothetical protein RND81_06G147600 [Saponaria officinalis]|uniref:Auxin-responsive protein n=1 Tax=Saponaria officinalis TaxID=3572 RepID=A0AAW1KDE7_SAPOF